MSKTMKKTLLIALIIFLTIIGAIAVVYLVRKPTVTPQPSPVSSKVEKSPTTAPIMVVDSPQTCSTTFVVACALSSPSSTPSSTPTPSPTPSGSPTPTPSPSTPPVAALSCVAKKMYVDDSRNRAGFYYMEQEITDTNTLANEQIIVYNIVTKNTGGNSVPDTMITDKLSDYLTYVDGDSGCTYVATTRVVTCTVGTLAANSEAQRSFRAKVSATGTISVANTAEVTSTNGQRDSCSVEIGATGLVVTAPSTAPTALPVAGVLEVTTGTLGIGLLLLILGGLGLLLI